MISDICLLFALRDILVFFYFCLSFLFVLVDMHKIKFGSRDIVSSTILEQPREAKCLLGITALCNLFMDNFKGDHI